MRRGTKWTENRPSSSRQSRGSVRRQRPAGTSEIYDDLLEEVLTQSSPNDQRPLKKRKSQRGPSDVVVVDGGSSEELRPGPEKDGIVIESFSNDASDDEDMVWDTIDLHPLSEDTAKTQTSPVIREVALVTTPQKSVFVYHL